ncbi:hypothetical protein [Streptomyces sp. NPDC048385]|uniref:hypothetical protein n=1 Tax=unclassified Streptomyces TaxID=2593676 RepID=UPI00343C221E
MPQDAMFGLAFETPVSEHPEFERARRSRHLPRAAARPGPGGPTVPEGPRVPFGRHG